jgi:hypothetical protein
MKRRCIFLVNAVFVLSAALAFGDTELHIERVASRVNSGFRERIYIDGKNAVTLANGRSDTVIVPDGPHRIYAELYTMKTGEVSFTASGGTVIIAITAAAMDDFAITITGAASLAIAPSGGAPARPASSPTPQRPIGQSTLEAALSAAANVVITKLPPRVTIAVVNIASRDTESAEFVVDELAYIIVSSGSFKVVDRKSLEAIRSEQDFQMSGEVDDDSAVSIGKLLGANIVITGSITGVGSTRRLRLKALDVMTAEIVAMASEAF